MRQPSVSLLAASQQCNFLTGLARNRRTYVFAGPYVYQIWRDAYGLQQKTPYLITDLFPNGPRTVHAAMTNRLTGVTVLFHDRTVYRYRWDRKGEKKRFKVWYPEIFMPKYLNLAGWLAKGAE